MIRNEYENEERVEKKRQKNGLLNLRSTLSVFKINEYIWRWWMAKAERERRGGWGWDTERKGNTKTEETNRSNIDWMIDSAFWITLGLHRIEMCYSRLFELKRRHKMDDKSIANYFIEKEIEIRWFGFSRSFTSNCSDIESNASIHIYTVPTRF